MHRRSLTLVVFLSVLWLACTTPSAPERATTATTPSAFVPAGTGYRARNATFGFEIRADAARVGVVGTGYDFGMRLVRVAGESIAPIAPTTEGTRLTFRHHGVTEWYTHDESGLEQGFDITRRVNHAGALDVELAVDGLAPRVREDGVLDLNDANGSTRLRYGKLHAFDARGIELASRLDTMQGHVVLHIDDANAVYPIAVDPLVWGVETAFVTSGVVYGGEGNSAVAISGNTLVTANSCSPVYLAENCDAGAPVPFIYVYVRSGATWSRQAVINPPSVAAENGEYAKVLALNADTLVVGAPHMNSQAPSYLGVGAAYIYARSGTTWSLQATLTRPDAPGKDYDNFGTSVAVDANTVIIGAQHVDLQPGSNNGAAYVYVRSGSTWSFQKELVYDVPAGSGSGQEWFGWAVAVSGDYAAVSAELNGKYSGEIQIFKRTGTSWTFVHRLTEGGNGSYLGSTLALQGDTLVAGAYGYSGIGAAFVYRRPSGSDIYAREQKIDSPDPVAGQEFGGAVALDNGTLGISSNSFYNKHIYAYVRSGTTWAPGQSLLGEPKAPTFGGHVGVSSNVLVTNGTSSDYKGGAYVFERAKANGDVCGAATECVSNFCVDGVCCESACTANCAACSAAKKKTGSDGKCEPVADGQDPDNNCGAAGTSCTAGVQDNGHVCNGKGVCRATTTAACTPYICGAKTCKTTCASDGDCVATAWCNGTTCVPKKVPGTACVGNNECAGTATCVDQVCCSTKCDGLCEACTSLKTGIPDSDGTCNPIADGRDPDDECVGTTCLDATLTDQVCDGAKACHGKTTSCQPFACDGSGTICATTCTKDEDCGASGYCGADQKCTPRKEQAAACDSTNQCGVSLTCVDGVCCNAPCEGQCQACDVAPNVGTCTPVTGAPHGSKRPECANGGKGCGGTCNGTDPLACSFPPATKACGDGCLDSSLTTCDGKGSCGAATACGGSLTCATATECRSTCTADTDCIAGYACTADHKCEPRSTACSADRKQSIDHTGAKTACAPVLCDVKAGVCGAFCQSENDCATGTTCDSTGRCITQSEAESPSGGGGGGGGDSGCALTPRATPMVPVWLVLLVLPLARRRRK